jgi:hypothetical protein
MIDPPAKFEQKHSANDHRRPYLMHREEGDRY